MLRPFVRSPILFGLLASLVLISCALDRDGQQYFDTGPTATSTTGSSGGATLTVGTTATSSVSATSTVTSTTTVTSTGVGGAGGMAATGVGGAGGMAATGVGGGGGMKLPVCGDGVIDAGEECDDDNTGKDDGCDDKCKIEPDWYCRGEPSDCVEPIEHHIDPTNIDLVQVYDGTLGSMHCFGVPVSTPNKVGGPVWLTTWLQSTRIADLVIKVKHPVNDTTLTVLSRPGWMEPNDTASDDMGIGFDCNMTNKKNGVLMFVDDATYPAEDMGDPQMNSPLGDGENVCEHGLKVCRYKPSPGAGPGMNFGDFKGLDPNGPWQVCFADADQNENNAKLHKFTLWVVAWP